MGKLCTCTDQLTEKLVALLREVDPDRFDSQIATLKDRGVPEQIIEALQNQQGSVVKKASEMTIGEGNIPFVPVIKPVYLGYYGLMSLVRSGAKEGYAYLNPTAVTDKVETPDDLYYIYDVEDGGSTRGKSPEAAEKIFKEQSRSPLTAAEAISLCVVKDVLSRHYVWAAGSRYESADWVPDVYLDFVGRPGLFWFHVGSSNDLWGSPSCGSR